MGNHEDGNKIYELETNSAFILKNYDDWDILTYYDNQNEVMLNLYDSHFTQKKSITKPSKLFTFFADSPLTFILILSSELLETDLFDEDELYEFAYSYKKRNNNTNQVYNVFAIAKENGNDLLSLASSAELGDIWSSSLAYDKTNSKPIYRATNYLTSTYNLFTEFYSLPFNTSLGVDNVKQHELVVYVDRANSQVKWNQKAHHFEVYAITGRLVKSGKNASQTSVLGMQKGVHIIKMLTTNGVVTKKFLL
ncbi:T9SS type A sorting domain-containing protein [Vaginella massiliensis]|uniref:T9SS type A sorting domain-containing protein n=1 Tax=Vaginella massiliensis TaxID=1816680 RepID=UPI000839AC6D|nr:T9SS type A sorting domain-containing protein [Vaginella massiliensis]